MHLAFAPERSIILSKSEATRVVISSETRCGKAFPHLSHLQRASLFL